jgi:LPS sulfotransferase NodH
MIEKNQGAKFVVLSSQRSGSTWLMNLLNQMDDTTAYGELFLRRKRDPEGVTWDSENSYPRFYEDRPGNPGVRPFSVLSYLGKVYQQPGAVGFKLMYSQVQKFPEILAYLTLRRVHVVHLVRQNLIAGIVSRAIKDKTRRAHRLAGEPELADIQVQLNPKKLIAKLERRERKIRLARRLLSWTLLPHIEVAYEELEQDLSCFHEVCSFLSIQSGGTMPKSSLVKLNRRPHAEVISNYSEVREALLATPFARYLE